jgi:hypothetical protein
LIAANSELFCRFCSLWLFTQIRFQLKVQNFLVLSAPAGLELILLINRKLFNFSHADRVTALATDEKCFHSLLGALRGDFRDQILKIPAEIHSRVRQLKSQSGVDSALALLV